MGDAPLPSTPTPQRRDAVVRKLQEAALAAVRRALRHCARWDPSRFHRPPVPGPRAPKASALSSAMGTTRVSLGRVAEG